MTAILVIDGPPAARGGYSARARDLSWRFVADRRPDLASDFTSGHDTALKRAYDEHGSLVYTFCRRSLGSDASAQDLTQEVFLAAWNARGRFDEDKGSLRSWLMGIARNKVIDSYRHRGRRPEVVSDDVGDRPGDASTVESIADRMVLAAALAELPERARTLVEMSFLQQLSHSEIVDRTGLPLGTIKSDIRRSLGRMRRHLETTS